MSSTRDQILETMCELMEAQGYNATGLNQILLKQVTDDSYLRQMSMVSN